MNQKERIQRYLQLLSGLSFSQRYYDFYQESPRGQHAHYGTRKRVEDALCQAGMEGLDYDPKEKGLRYLEAHGDLEVSLDTYFTECTIHYFLTVKTSDWRIRAGCEILALEAARLDEPNFEPDPMYPKLWFNDAASLREVAEFGAAIFRDVRDAVLDSELVDGLNTSVETAPDDEPAPARSQQIFDPGPPCRLYRLEHAEAEAEAALDKEDALELGGAWAGLHVVLTGEPPVPRPKLLELGLTWSGDPLQMALMGGESTSLVGNYEPYRWLTADQVQEIARALQALSVPQFEELYAPEDLDSLQIPPGSWHDPSYRHWLTTHYESLRDWYADTARKKMSVLIAID